jgi:hypothetical protein
MAQQGMAQQGMAGRISRGWASAGGVGTVSLVVEASLVVLSVAMMLALRQRPSSATPTGA